MWPDRVSNPAPLTLESDALPIALRSPASKDVTSLLFTQVGVINNTTACSDVLCVAVTHGGNSHDTENLSDSRRFISKMRFHTFVKESGRTLRNF